MWRTKILTLPIDNPILLYEPRLRRSLSISGREIFCCSYSNCANLPTLFIDFWSLATPCCTFNESQRATYVLIAPTSRLQSCDSFVATSVFVFAFAHCVYTRLWIVKSRGIAECWVVARIFIFFYIPIHTYTYISLGLFKMEKGIILNFRILKYRDDGT